MDDETRFRIAQELADTKDTHDARRLFQVAKERTGKRPGPARPSKLPKPDTPYRGTLVTYRAEVLLFLSGHS